MVVDDEMGDDEMGEKEALINIKTNK